MNKKPDAIKRMLTDPIHVHYHHGDREPHLTPLAMCDLERLHHDTLAYIQQLEDERDSAVKDMTSIVGCPCGVCKYYLNDAHKEPCNSCRMIRKGKESNFEWRGMQKEDSNA